MNHPLHQKAVHLAKEFKHVEIELVDVLQKIDAHKLFRQMGFASLFEYVHRELGLSEGVSYALINVSRKSAVVPELKMAIQAGELSVSQAKRVTSVITRENAPGLIEKAKTLTQREMEKEVARIHPQPPSKEKTRYLTEDKIELRVTLREEVMNKLKRSQDLESQRTRSASSLEQTIEAIVDFYLEKNDPVSKSERILTKQSLRIVDENGGRKEVSKEPKMEIAKAEEYLSNKMKAQSNEKKYSGLGRPRAPISSNIKHQVNSRDQGRCTYRDRSGQRCSSRCWLELHHLQPLSQGGDNAVQNLTTLCQAHHKIRHNHYSHDDGVLKSPDIVPQHVIDA